METGIKWGIIGMNVSHANSGHRFLISYFIGTLLNYKRDPYVHC